MTRAPRVRRFPDLSSVAEWIIALCLESGAHLHTALLVAGTFTADRDIRRRFDPEGVAAEEAAERASLQVREQETASAHNRRIAAAAKAVATRRARKANR